VPACGPGRDKKPRQLRDVSCQAIRNNRNAVCPIRVEFRHIRVDIAVLLKMLGVIDEYIRSYE
jgi:hypothetical protein